jgi:hypothetical protein
MNVTHCSGAAGFTTVTRYNNFNSGDRANPCPVR